MGGLNSHWPKGNAWMVSKSAFVIIKCLFHAVKVTGEEVKLPARVPGRDTIIALKLWTQMDFKMRIVKWSIHVVKRQVHMTYAERKLACTGAGRILQIYGAGIFLFVRKEWFARKEMQYLQDV